MWELSQKLEKWERQCILSRNVVILFHCEKFEVVVVVNIIIINAAAAAAAATTTTTTRL